MKEILSLIYSQLLVKPIRSSRILSNIMIQPDLKTNSVVTQSQSLLQFVIENDRTAIALLDRDLRYIYVSKRYLHDYGVKEPEVMGKYHYEVFPDLPESWKEVHRRALKGEVISSEEDPFERLDGSIDWVRWECRPWFEENGNIGGIILYTEVITRQKETEFELIKAKERAEKNEQSMADILYKLNEAQSIANIGSWDWNVQTGKVWWSDELYRIFEVDTMKFAPTSEGYVDFLHPEDKDSYLAATMNSIKTGDMLDYQIRIITGKGNLKHCKSTARVFFDINKNPIRMTGTFIDISEQVRILNELNTAKERAEESDRLKTAFLQNMSHEVRTPLNSIVGFSELLTEPGQSLQKIRSFSRIISSNSNKLIGIISDVIEISQIQAGQISVVVTRFDVVPLLYKVADPFREILQLKDIDFIINQNIANDASIIESDKGKLEKVFYHLIDNAVKFTHHGSITADISIEGSSLIFRISDTGIGIPEEKKKIIFDPFRQLETGLSRSYGGTGLGLTIVKAYVDAMEGTIVLDSHENEGTSFSVTLPVAVTGRKATGEPDNKHDHVDTILIAEDEYSNFKYLYEVLHADGLEILHANNGKEAIEICRKSNDIKMVLMDIKMPVMDGTVAAKLIKEFRPGLPIIAQTAYVPDEDNVNSVFDDLISKPINRLDLKRKMSKYINV